MFAVHGQRTHRSQDANRHGKVEARALFAHVGGSEIDGDSLVGISETGIDQSGLDALATLAHRDIGHPDHSEIARRAGIHVDFDIDHMSIDAVNGGAVSFEQRHELWA
jgi:hypothetical protein